MGGHNKDYNSLTSLRLFVRHSLAMTSRGLPHLVGSLGKITPFGSDFL